MKIAIAVSDNEKNIAVVKDYTNITDKGQISHFLMELEFIKQDLLQLWAEWCMEEDEDGRYF
ncbi:MAG: hypothetical protein ACFFD1_04585 [Candidatus Thorarchaeota archaeon]